MLAQYEDENIWKHFQLTWAGSTFFAPNLLTLCHSCNPGLSGQRFKRQGEIQNRNVGIQIFLCSIIYNVLRHATSSFINFLSALHNIVVVDDDDVFCFAFFFSFTKITS